MDFDAVLMGACWTLICVLIGMIAGACWAWWHADQERPPEPPADRVPDIVPPSWSEAHRG